MWPTLKRLLIQPFLSANGHIQTTLLVSTRVACPYKAVGWLKIFHASIWLHPLNSTNKNYSEPAAPHQDLWSPAKEHRLAPEGPYFCPERGYLPDIAHLQYDLSFLSMPSICCIRTYHLNDPRQKKNHKNKGSNSPGSSPSKSGAWLWSTVLNQNNNNAQFGFSDFW